MNSIDMMKKIIRQIGDDPEREGLRHTPDRIIQSFKELYSGYSAEPIADLFTTFMNDCYDEMVLLKNVEFYSMCEHHMLPFFGKAHIAYIPKDKIVGISKLARLLEIYTRRLQIQERIGFQVTNAITAYLAPLGAACILEAQHFCMISRGVQKQHSIMITSSLTGVFLEKPEAREELIKLIK